MSTGTKPGTPAATYDAFVSYGQAADRELAPAIRKGLQQLAKPWYRRRALNVYLDKTGLEVTPELWSTLARALDQSAYLVLLASPETARSDWVNREVKHWLAGHSAARILPVLSAGEWVWDEAAGDLRKGCTAVPPALFGAFGEEPRFLDLRGMVDRTDLDLRHNSEFRDAIAQLAAPMHGRPKSELEGEDIRQHRKSIRTAWSAVAALVLLLVATGIAALLAVNSAATAREQRDVATSRQLAAQATVRLDSDPQLATLLGLAATQITDRYEAQSAQLQLLEHDKQVLRFLGGHTNVVEAAAFSPDGKLLATGSPDGRILLWDVATGSRIATLPGHTRRVTSVALSPDGHTVAAGGAEGTVLVWDSRTGAQTATIPGYPSQLKGRVAFSPDGTLLALSGRSGAVQLWKVADGSLHTLKGHPRTVQSLAFLDLTTLVSGSFDGALVVWDLPSETIRQSAISPISPISPVTAIAVGPDHRTAASGGFDGTAVLWDLSRSFAEQVGTPTMVLAATGDPTGRLVATAEFSGAVVVRDPERGADPVLTLQAPDLVNALSFSLDRTRLATGLPHGTVLVWDLAHQRLDRTLDARSDFGVVSVAYSPDGALLAAGLIDGRVVVRGARDGRQVADLPAPERLADVTGLTGLVNMKLAFSPDSRTLAYSTVNSAVLWDVTNRTVRARLAGPSSLGTTSLAFSLNGRVVAQGGLDSKIVLWDPDRPSQPVAVLAGQPSSVTGLAFSPDGRILASVGSSGTVILWDVDLRAQHAVLTDRGRLVDVAFADRGRRLFVADPDMGLQSYDLDPGSWRRRLCDLVGRTLSDQEWHAYVDDRDYQPVCEPTR